MKKALLMMLLLCAVLAGQVGQDNRLTVALDVRGVVPIGTSAAGAALSGELATAIGRSGKYVVVNRSPEALKAIAQEINYTQTGAVKEAKAMREKIGKQDTVSFLCVVMVTGDSKGGYHVRAVLTHVATGRESESATAASRFEDIFEVMAVAKRLAKDLTGVDLGTWTAGKSAGTVDRDFNDEKTGISMVFVQGGTTVFGCGNISESRTEYSGECAGVAESPEAKMTLKDYYISRYEITQEEWVKVMGSNPSHFQARFLERLPVENISYGDVQTFIAKLNAMTGRKYRLPSYIEWYYAALGGVKSKGYNYIGSDNIRDVAWFMENSDQKTHEVGQRAPNELRLYDMAGNVWEFVSLSPAGEEGYAFVGGGWNSGITLLKPSILTQETGDPKYPVLGFRLALDP